EAITDFPYNPESSPKTTFLSIDCCLVISQVVFHFPKLQKFADHQSSWPIASGLTKVHPLYSSKNTALSSPRHVGCSVNQRLRQVAPAAGIVSMSK
ncbi:hypothetical protein AVEN_100610-1, partial [Araneus ventricosus]